MTDTKKQEEIFEWISSNWAYGHLDSIPDNILGTLIADQDLCLFAGEMLLGASMCKQPDDFHEFIQLREVPVKTLIDSAIRVRNWIISEKLRRMGKLKITVDMLLREIASKNVHGLARMDGKPFTGSYAEVRLGMVTFVGEEIDLCQK